MKKMMLFLFLAMTFIPSNAIKYRELGRFAKFAVYTFDGVKYLLLVFEDDKDYQLTPNTIIKFKLNNGEIIKIQNFQAGERQKSRAINWMGIASIASENVHYTMFEVTPEVQKMLDIGIKRIAINTIPEVYIYGGNETENFGTLLNKDFEKLKGEMDDDNKEINT